jgi:hypothetical protein
LIVDLTALPEGTMSRAGLRYLPALQAREIIPNLTPLFNNYLTIFKKIYTCAEVLVIEQVTRGAYYPLSAIIP